MCINFNGYHSGGSIFVNVKDCWLLQKKKKKKKKKGVPVYGFTPRKRFGFANRVEPGSGA